MTIYFSVSGVFFFVSGTWYIEISLLQKQLTYRQIKKMTVNVSFCLICTLFEDEDQYGSIRANVLFVFVLNV
jgi:hypothetical protein